MTSITHSAELSMAAPPPPPGPAPPPPPGPAPPPPHAPAPLGPGDRGLLSALGDDGAGSGGQAAPDAGPSLPAEAGPTDRQPDGAGVERAGDPGSAWAAVVTGATVAAGARRPGLDGGADAGASRGPSYAADPVERPSRPGQQLWGAVMQAVESKLTSFQPQGFANIM